MYKLEETKLQRVRREVDGKVLLVVGGNGALGLSLAYCLTHYKITPSHLIVTNLSSDLDSSWYNVGAQVLQIRSGEPEATSDLISSALQKIGRPYIIIFMAGYGQPSKFFSQPGATIIANTTALENILELKPRADYVAYMSTAEVYSGHKEEVFEGDSLLVDTRHKRAIYVYSKLLGEAILANWNLRSGVRAASYRVALAFAPKVLPGDTRVLGELMYRALTTKHVVLKGGRHLFRQYQYGPNAMIQIVSSLINGSEPIYNCAGDHRLTLEDLATLIATVTESSSTIIDIDADGSSQQTMDINYKLITRDSGIIIGSNLSLKSYLRMVVDESATSL
jgi:nucleoside-diphosphate-sugar epimerase